MRNLFVKVDTGAKKQNQIFEFKKNKEHVTNLITIFRTIQIFILFTSH